MLNFKRFELIEEYDIDGNSETAFYDNIDHDSISFCDERFDNLILKKLNNMYKEKTELERILQDYEDTVSDFFIDNWLSFSEEVKQQAHLELGIDIDYDEDLQRMFYNDE